MRIIILIAIVLTSFSCVTQEKCLKKFPCTSGRDSIYIEKLDTVQILIPGDTVKVETKVPCEDFELITENTKLKQELRVINGKLMQKLTIKPDTIYSYKTNTITKTQYVPRIVFQKETPRFWLITGWVGISFIILVIALLALKIKKTLTI